MDLATCESSIQVTKKAKRRQEPQNKKARRACAQVVADLGSLPSEDATLVWRITPRGGDTESKDGTKRVFHPNMWFPEEVPPTLHKLRVWQAKRALEA